MPLLQPFCSLKARDEYNGGNKMARFCTAWVFRIKASAFFRFDFIQNCNHHQYVIIVSLCYVDFYSIVFKCTYFYVKNFLEPAMFCHLAVLIQLWQGKGPKVHAKQKGFQNFFSLNKNCLLLLAATFINKLSLNTVHYIVDVLPKNARYIPQHLCRPCDG